MAISANQVTGQHGRMRATAEFDALVPFVLAGACMGEHSRIADSHD
jgi:hypothetical protein